MTVAKKLERAARRAAGLRTSLRVMLRKQWKNPEHWICLSIAIGNTTLALAKFSAVSDSTVNEYHRMAITAESRARDIFNAQRVDGRLLA